MQQTRGKPVGEAFARGGVSYLNETIATVRHAGCEATVYELIVLSVTKHELSAVHDSISDCLGAEVFDTTLKPSLDFLTRLLIKFIPHRLDRPEYGPARTAAHQYLNELFNIHTQAESRLQPQKAAVALVLQAYFAVAKTLYFETQNAINMAGHPLTLEAALKR